MPHRTLLLGIDLSTTGAKALLIDEAGTVIASASTPLTLSTPHPLWAEQQPRDWWQASGRQHPDGARDGGGQWR